MRRWLANALHRVLANLEDAQGTPSPTALRLPLAQDPPTVTSPPRDAASEEIEQALPFADAEVPEQGNGSSSGLNPAVEESSPPDAKAIAATQHLVAPDAPAWKEVDLDVTAEHTPKRTPPKTFLPAQAYYSTPSPMPVDQARAMLPQRLVSSGTQFLRETRKAGGDAQTTTWPKSGDKGVFRSPAVSPPPVAQPTLQRWPDRPSTFNAFP